MNIYVQKFGGTSVATKEARECAYEKILEAKKRYGNIVVIVSAMGRVGDPYATDTLLNLVRKESKTVNLRELDMIYACGEMISASVMASALNDRNLKAVSLTGQQAGIVTDDTYFEANIKHINTERIRQYLSEGIIPVISGSQGATEQGEITTLGRGGSDISAVALGVALKARQVDIYTDVDGVMTADPCRIDNTRLLETIDYESCCVLSERGAKVVHPRAVQIAKQDPKMRVYIKSTFSDCPGTYITTFDDSDSRILSVTNESCQSGELITVVGINLREDAAAEIKSILSEFRIQYRNDELCNNSFSFITDRSMADKTVRILHQEIFVNRELRTDSVVKPA